MEYQKKYQIAMDSLLNFNNYIEISDFRRFILLILNLDSGGPEAMLQVRRHVRYPCRNSVRDFLCYCLINTGYVNMQGTTIIPHGSNRLTATAAESCID